jgi:hypothetical protein
MPWKPSVALAIALFLAGCQTTTGIGGTSVCSVWRPIQWSVNDTRETQEQVVLSNARRKGYCE